MREILIRFVLVNFWKLVLFERRKTAYLKQIVHKKPYSCCRNFYQLISQVRDIFFTSFYFHFVSYVNFIFTEILICYSDFYFIVRSSTIEENYPVKGRKYFYQYLAMLQIWFWSEKRFSTYGLKNFCLTKISPIAK